MSARWARGRGDWTRPEDDLPPEGVVVETMDSGGHVQPLVRERGLWFFPDRSMYVYYTPTFWKHAPAHESPDQ